MTASCSCKVVAEKTLSEQRVQLVEDSQGGYHLQKVSLDRKRTLFRAPVHSDLGVLAEARDLFPDLLPFGGLPVDAA